MNQTLLDVQCWVKGEVPYDPTWLLSGQEPLLPGLVLALQSLHFLWLLFSWTCKRESIHKDKVQAMLAWVGEHGYDPRDLNRRYDVELRGIPIARACCGTMPNIVKKQSDYSGLPFRYTLPERGSLSPFEMISTLAQCNVPLATIRRLTSIYELPDLKVDWVERIYLRYRPESFDLLKKRAFEASYDKPYRPEDLQKESVLENITRISTKREYPVDPTVQRQHNGCLAALKAMPTKVGLGINHPQSYMVEQWLAGNTKMRSSSASLSEVDTIMMNPTPALVNSDSTSSQTENGPRTPHSRLFEDRRLATIHNDRCLSEYQNPAPYRYSTEYYPYEVSSKIRHQPIE